MKIATTTGGPTDVAEAEIDELRMMLRGPLLCAGQPGYDEARVVYNGMFDRRPALIARCRGAADVVDAVRFASRRRLLTDNFFFDNQSLPSSRIFGQGAELIVRRYTVSNRDE
jgi:hypothetical protein